jgi:hypothetical protein
VENCVFLESNTSAIRDKAVLLAVAKYFSCTRNTCSTHGGDKICEKNWSENLQERDHLEDIVIDGKNIK